MMFEIVMNMPVRDGAMVHRIICQHPAVNLDAFTKELQTKDYVIVDEFYPDQLGKYANHGQIALNHRYVGKIKEWKTK